MLNDLHRIRDRPMTIKPDARVRDAASQVAGFSESGGSTLEPRPDPRAVSASSHRRVSLATAYCGPRPDTGFGESGDNRRERIGPGCPRRALDQSWAICPEDTHSGGILPKSGLED